MVGTWGRSSTRLAEVTASARSLLLRIWPMSVGTEDMYNSTVPLITSVMAWAAPLYGMCCALMPAAFWNISLVRCATVPLPGEA
jgi:hypothetical protein